MKRGGPLKRYTPLKPVNRKRKKKRHAEASGPQAELCRTLPCSACQAPPPSDPAHIRSRGAGGKDRANCVPLCRSCHVQQHTQGWLRFQMNASVAFAAIAQELEQQAYP